MSLLEAREGQQCRIVRCDATGKTRARLDSLGLVPGATIDVLCSSWAGIIVNIKGSHLAICRDVAEQLSVA